MTDIVEKLKRIADAASYADGTDTPLGEQVRAGAKEIERLREDLRSCTESWHVIMRNKLAADAKLKAMAHSSTESRGGQ